MLLRLMEILLLVVLINGCALVSSPRVRIKRTVVIITVKENDVRTARITRTRTDEDGTFGMLVLDSGEFMFTIEPELNDNKSNISCIPTGMYKAVRHRSPTFGECYLIKGVAGRSNILIHSGNVEDNTQGCIILGITSGKIDNKKAVLSSRTAIGILEDAFDKKEFFLTITDNY